MAPIELLIIFKNKPKIISIGAIEAEIFMFVSSVSARLGQSSPTRISKNTQPKNFKKWEKRSFLQGTKTVQNFKILCKSLSELAALVFL